MTMLDDLIARIARGTAEEQGRFLEEAWDAAAEYSAEFRRFATAPCSGFGNNAGKFAATLEARAYESAALMLVPDGWDCGLDIVSGADVVGASLSKDPGPYIRVDAPTPALALVLASLKARRAMEASDGD
jgi:hypothetical protein